MTGKIVELYSDADLARLERRVRRWRVGLLVLAAPRKASPNLCS